MNVFIITLTILLTFLDNNSNICAHVDRMGSGVFQGYQDLQNGKCIDLVKISSAIFEKGSNNEDSNVFDIHGSEQFERIVIKNSYFRPVVLKIYLPTHKDIDKVTNVFQDVAKNFNLSVVFAGLDIIKNTQLYMQIHATCNLKSVKLPLFLFYYNGQLRMPFLMGNQHKDYFIAHLKKMFFAQND